MQTPKLREEDTHRAEGGRFDVSQKNLHYLKKQGEISKKRRLSFCINKKKPCQWSAKKYEEGAGKHDQGGEPYGDFWEKDTNTTETKPLAREGKSNEVPEEKGTSSS